MRSFDCQYYHLSNNKLPTLTTNPACWGSIPLGKTIYIDKYIEPETTQHIQKLLSIVNEIRECEIVDVAVIENEANLPPNERCSKSMPCSLGMYRQCLMYGYSCVKKPELKETIKRLIKFPLYNEYNKNVLLLNFVRNLWHEPIPNYTKIFFDNLDGHKDPMKRLTYANMIACRSWQPKSPYMELVGHSNVYKNAGVRTIKQFKEAKWEKCKYGLMSTQTFLTQ